MLISALDININSYLLWYRSMEYSENDGISLEVYPLIVRLWYLSVIRNISAIYYLVPKFIQWESLIFSKLECRLSCRGPFSV